MDSNEQINFGKEIISFSLQFVGRKTLGISVNPDLSVEVKAPENSDYKQVIKKVKKKAPWILRQLRYFESFLPRTPERKYVSGETHLFLGKQYKLKILKGKTDFASNEGNKMFVTAKDRDPNQVKQILARWYYEHATKKLNQRFLKVSKKLEKYEIYPVGLRFRRMNARWGSCSKRGLLTLNPELIKADLGCIDYVITHELTHIKHYGHGKDFKQFMDIVMSDWKKWKEKLEVSMS